MRWYYFFQSQNRDCRYQWQNFYSAYFNACSFTFYRKKLYPQKLWDLIIFSYFVIIKSNWSYTQMTSEYLDQKYIQKKKKKKILIFLIANYYAREDQLLYAISVLSLRLDKTQAHKHFLFFFRITNNLMRVPFTLLLFKVSSH